MSAESIGILMMALLLVLLSSGQEVRQHGSRHVVRAPRSDRMRAAIWSSGGDTVKPAPPVLGSRCNRYRGGGPVRP